MKRVFLLIGILAFLASNMYATVLLTEDFDYSAGTAIGEVEGWTTTGTLTTGTGRTTNATTLDYSNAGGIYGHSGSKTLQQGYSAGNDYISARGFQKVTSGAVYLTYMYKADGNQSQGQSELLGLTYSSTKPSARPWVGKLASGTTDGSVFRFGLTQSSGNSSDIKWATGEYSKDNVHLIVLKYDFVNSRAALFINPTLGTSEEPEANITDNTGSLRNRIDTLMFRNNGNSKANYYIGGIRVSTTWDEAVRAVETPPAGISSIVTDFNDGTWGDIATNKYTSGSYPNGTINGFQFTAAGMLNGSTTYTETLETFQNRISMDKMANGGAVTLPTLSTINKINIYANSGTANQYMTLQQYNYRTGLWEDIDTYYFETTACYKFSTTINSNRTTRLRIANASSGTKYIWKIESVPNVTRERFVANFSDDEWSSLGNDYTTRTINDVNFTQCSLGSGTYYCANGEKFTKRINVDKLSNEGMMEFPAVVSATQIDIYAAAGSANKDLTIQQYDYNKSIWEDIETLHFEVGSTYLRFPVILNNASTTKLRIKNSDGSSKYILKVVTYASAPTKLASPSVQEATNISAHSFTARWSSVSGATGYRIIRYKDGTIQRVETVGEEVTTFTFRDSGEKGVAAATEYSYTVVAIGNDETIVDSDPSDQINLTTAAEISDSYTRSVTNGNYGTICLPKASADLSIAGAVFYEVAGKIMEGGKLKQVVFDEVTELAAGVPYVFQATASELNIPLTGDAVAEPVSSGSNGLIGSFAVTKVSSSVYKFILSNNLLYCTKNNEYYVGENRAYFDISSMSVFSGESPAPGRRRAYMTTEENQTATSIDNTPATNKATKQMIDGKIIIIRDGEKFDLTGQRL